MNRSVTCFLLLLFSVLIGSCTVEKRLYNKGWHVSVNRSWKNDRSRPVDTPAAVAEVPSPEESLRQEEHPTEESAAGPVVTTDTPVSMEAEQPTVVASGEETIVEASLQASIPADTVVIEKTHAGSSLKPENYWARGTKTTVSIILGVLTIAAIMGLVLLLGSVFSTTLAVAEFIFLGLFLFALAILMIILFFVALTIPTSEEMHERTEDKRQADDRRKKELDELSPEAREERLDAEARKKDMRTNVLSILGVLFAAALVIPFLLK